MRIGSRLWDDKKVSFHAWNYIMKLNESVFVLLDEVNCIFSSAVIISSAEVLLYGSVWSAHPFDGFVCPWTCACFVTKSQNDFKLGTTTSKAIPRGFFLIRSLWPTFSDLWAKVHLTIITIYGTCQWVDLIPYLVLCVLCQVQYAVHFTIINLGEDMDRIQLAALHDKLKASLESAGQYLFNIACKQIYE